MASAAPLSGNSVRLVSSGESSTDELVVMVESLESAPGVLWSGDATLPSVLVGWVDTPADDVAPIKLVVLSDPGGAEPPIKPVVLSDPGDVGPPIKLVVLSDPGGAEPPTKLVVLSDPGDVGPPIKLVVLSDPGDVGPLGMFEVALPGLVVLPEESSMLTLLVLHCESGALGGKLELTGEQTMFRGPEELTGRLN